MNPKTLILQRDVNSAAYRHQNRLFICTDIIEAITDEPAPLIIKLRISRWRPSRAKHWMQVEINNDSNVIIISQPTSLTDIVQQYTNLPTYTSLRDLIASYSHPIYLSLIS